MSQIVALPPKVDDSCVQVLEEALPRKSVAQHEKCWNERDIVDRIADCLIEDHIDLMRQNKMLREVVAELLDEHYPASCYTAETIEYEMEQGNMAMPMVKRAYAALLEKNK